ncbi:5-oxoprolinase subunit PxpB [Winogradskyella endarachnes]|nr:5-oxoprolinase subunit PxpB [Winogradskyella endarachnes]
MCHLKYSQYNERSILIEWPAFIDKNIGEDVLFFKNKIENSSIKDIVEVICSYNSILVIYASTIENINSAFLDLKSLYLDTSKVQIKNCNTIRIPVCYDDEFSTDLKNYSIEKKLSKSEIITLHTAPIYTVFFIGFLPGFLYLGGLNSQLHLDRKTTPNLNVKKGSVAIGGNQTGIYPQDSPGGWHIIGNSPLELFNPKTNPPCYIKAGDKVKFYAISKSEYLEFQAEIKNASFNIQSLFVND